jgi:cbb3-type cytochrome c oxidase subunit II
MTPAVILAGILSLLAAIAATVVYWPYATADMAPSDIFRPRTAAEEAGRQIYLDNGCVYCHTQSIRAFDWGHGAERIAQSGDYIADEPIALGSQRTGVDLSQEGGEHPDDWHIAHFVNPRYTRPSSLMPPFEWLGEDRLQTLTDYIQSLGFKLADERMARQRHW